MYSKQEASQIRQAFWTALGQYLSPIPSAEGEKINWINYKTGEKYIAFKMQTLHKSATISIEISHPDTGVQQLYFEQFVQLKTAFETIAGNQWQWELFTQDDTGKTISRIYAGLTDKSVLNKNHWPDLISFFKPRIIALDAFWSNARYAFEMLR